VPGSSAPSNPKNVRRGQARRARRRRAGGGPGLLRGPQAGGRGVPAAGRGRGGCGGAQDPAQERRHEGGDAAGGLRNCPRRKSLTPSLSLCHLSSCARFGVFVAPPFLTGCSLGFGDLFVFFSVDSFPVGQAFEKHSMEKDIAEYIKKEFDKNHGPTWHCIVGRNFGNILLPTPLWELLLN